MAPSIATCVQPRTQGSRLAAPTARSGVGSFREIRGRTIISTIAVRPTASDW